MGIDFPFPLSVAYHITVDINWAIGLMSRVFTNGQGDRDSIPGRIIPKTQEILLDAALLNTQHYKVKIKGKVEQSREEVAPSGVVAPSCVVAPLV